MPASSLSRVVWSEGMHLAQHHFQAQSRYFESTFGFALSNVFSEGYGLLHLAMDHDALWDGTVAVLEASGVMPDGLPFHFGEGDVGPEPRNANALFGPTDDAQLLYLSIPRLRSQGGNAVESGGTDPGARYEAHTVMTIDENSGVDPRPVVFGRKRFRLLGSSELDEGLVSMPIARVTADRAGRPIYDPHFVPPVLQTRGSTHLTRLLTDTLELLYAKMESLRPGSADTDQGAASELVSTWMRHAILAGIPPLRLHAESGRSHPRRVYEDLARLAGALCTFSLETDPLELPLYHHGSPTEAFLGLYEAIKTGLEATVPEGAMRIPLEPFEANFHGAPLKDPRTLEDAEWVLSVRSSQPEAKILRDVPQLVKICSAEDVKRLVQDANPALRLEATRVPPPGISPARGETYFRISLEGPSWSLIQKRSSVGAYVPDSLADARLDLVVLTG